MSAIIMDRIEAVTAPVLKYMYGKKDLNKLENVAKMNRKMRSIAAWAKEHPEDTDTWTFHFDDRDDARKAPS